MVQSAMRKTAIWIMAIFLLCNICYASDWGYVDQNITLWADAINETKYININHTEITIYDAQGNIKILSQNMSNVATGLYKYVYTPNTTGVHYASVQYFNSSANSIGYASQSFAIHQDGDIVLEDSLLYFIIVLGIVAIAIIYLIALNFIKIDEVPKGRILEKGILYAAAIVTPSIISFLLLILIQRSPAINHLEAWSLGFFVITLLIMLASMYSLAFHIVQVVLAGASDE